MEEFPNEFSKRDRSVAVPKIDVKNTEKLLVDLTTLLKFKKTSELISTFQAGTIPITLDIISRDPSEEGRKIVTALLKQIEELKNYYKAREKKEEAKPEEPGK